MARIYSNWNNNKTRIFLEYSFNTNITENYTDTYVSLYLQINSVESHNPGPLNYYIARDDRAIYENRNYFYKTVNHVGSPNIKQYYIGSVNYSKYHDNEGNGQIILAGWSDWGFDNLINNTAVNLPKIDRFATFSYGSDFTDEESPLIAYFNPAQLPVNLRIEFSGVSINRRVDVYPPQGKYWFALTEEERNLLRQKCTGNELQVRLVVSTIINGQEANWSISDSYYLRIVNANPVFNNFTFEDTNILSKTLTGNNQVLIKGISSLKTIITSVNKMVALKSASAIKYRLNVGSKSNEVNYAVTDVNMSVNEVDSGIIIITAVDSRGNDKQVTKTADIKEYAKPIINEAVFDRQEGVSETVNIIAKGTYTPTNFGAKTNTIPKIEYSIDNGTTWINITDKFLIKTDGTFENKKTGNTVTGFIFGTQYNVILKVTDGCDTNLISEVKKHLTISDGEPIVAFNKQKKIVGVGIIPNNNLKKGTIEAKEFAIRCGTDTVPLFEIINK
ncbi:MAG: hypothetical protein RR406_04995 [Bacilli bacterium]